jgi:hypothetical protein
VSQLMMANKLGIYNTRYGRVERGRVPNLCICTFRRYAERLGLTVCYLLRGSDWP